MTPRRAIVAAVVLLVLGVALWRSTRDPAPALPPTEVPADTTRAGGGSPKNADRRSPPPPATAEHSPLADALNSAATDIQSDLRVVNDVLHAFQTNFPREGNPVGSNAEITAALIGRNPLRLALIPPNHPAVNRAGELCDRWGTPFFFHAESSRRMEIRSAGPDRKMWTEDDVTFAP